MTLKVFSKFKIKTACTYTIKELKCKIEIILSCIKYGMCLLFGRLVKVFLINQHGANKLSNGRITMSCGACVNEHHL